MEKFFQGAGFFIGVEGSVVIMKELVSIIVPIYRVQDYINKCVESIMAQTYSNIEIILVDDESPDNCPEICDDYAKKDARVRVIHKKNGGLSDARNAGLEMATGEYIAFVDGDDYVSSDYIQALYEVCVKDESDISCCGYYRVYGEKLIKAPKSTDKKLFTGIEAIRDIFTAGTLCEVMAWNKLYKRSLFIDYNIRFPVGKIHEDTFTTYKLFYYAERVGFIDKPLYYYIQRNDSIMGQTFNAKRLDVLDMLREAEEFFSEKKVSFYRELQSARLLLTLGAYNDYLKTGSRDVASGERLHAALSQIGNIFGNPLIANKHKVLYSLARVNPWLYGMLRTKYDRREYG